MQAWNTRFEAEAGEEDEFTRTCPDRMASSSRPRPPPSLCFAQIGPADKQQDDDDEASLTEESLTEVSLAEEDDPSLLLKLPGHLAAPSSVEKIQASRRRKNKLGASIRSFFDSFREGEIEEVSLQGDDEEDDDELSRSEPSVADTEVSLEELEFPTPFKLSSSELTPQSSIEALKAARSRNNNIGTNLVNFFDSFRDGDVHEITFEEDDSSLCSLDDIPSILRL